MKRNYLIIVLLILTGTAGVLAQVPKVTSFSPLSGPIGTVVTINGRGFSSLPDSNTVYFGATRAKVTSTNGTQLSVIVPAGATNKPITITNKVTRLIGHSTVPFRTSFSPLNTDIDKPVRIAKDTGASDVQVVDVDGDGKPDIIATNPTLRLLMVYRNISTVGSIGTSSFATPIVYKTGPQPSFAAVDDMDGDGKPDIVLLNGSYSYGTYAFNSFTFFHNFSTPGHIVLSPYPGVDSSGKMPSNGSFKLSPGDNSARLLDFDGDGKVDIAVANSAGFVSVYPNVYFPGSTNIWGPPVKFATGLGVVSMSVGDIDGDGKLDIITANADSSSITLLHNTSTPGSITTSSFQRSDFPLGFRPLLANIADIDGDGIPDIIIARADGKPTILVHNTTVPGHYNGSVASLSGIKLSGNFNKDMLIQDINGDGAPDLLTPNANPGSLYLYTNKSTPGQSGSDYFNNPADFAVTTLPDCIADLDGDGRPELISGSIFGIDIYHSKAAPITTNIILPTAVADSISFNQVLSPNSDGINDVFTINNIQKFPNNKLIIINANGAKVYEASNYGTNEKLFDGHSSITGILQKQGTYFYQLQYKAASGPVKVKTGYFVLKY